MPGQDLGADSYNDIKNSDASYHLNSNVGRISHFGREVSLRFD